VRADNIFLGSENSVRLSGFHHAIFIQDCDRWLGKPDQVQYFDETLSDVFIWLAPEVLKQDLRGYGTSSDIYSLGICLCEMGNGFAPFRVFLFKNLFFRNLSKVYSFKEMDPLQILFEKLRGSTPFLLDSKDPRNGEGLCV
jgi:STE20-related kinase adapter protein alpha